MESFFGILFLLVSLAVTCTESSTLLFVLRDVYSELSAEGHVTVGRRDNPLGHSSVSTDPLGIMVKLLDARFYNSRGDVINRVNIGTIPHRYDDYYFMGEEQEKKQVLFQIYPYELEEYQNIYALGRKMTAEFREAGVRLEFSVYIFMKTGVLNKGTDLEHTVHQGHVRLDLGFSRLAGVDCGALCEQVAGVELDVWIRGRGPVTKAGNNYYSTYDMAHQSRLTIPHKAMSGSRAESVRADCSSAGDTVNLTLGSDLPSSGAGPLLYSLTIRPADIPPPGEEIPDHYNYMDQEPNGDGDDGAPAREEEENNNNEVKDAQLRSSSSHCATWLVHSLTCAALTFFLSHGRVPV